MWSCITIGVFINTLLAYRSHRRKHFDPNVDHWTRKRSRLYETSDSQDHTRDSGSPTTTPSPQIPYRRLPATSGRDGAVIHHVHSTEVPVPTPTRSGPPTPHPRGNRLGNGSGRITPPSRGSSMSVSFPPSYRPLCLDDPVNERCAHPPPPPTVGPCRPVF